MSTEAFSAAQFGIGTARTTEFSGSSDYTFIPFAEFNVDTRIGNFSNNQLGFELDLINNDTVETGPILRLNTGRNDTVSDDVIAGLPEIESTAEVGWFVGSGYKLSNFGLTSNAIVIGDLSIVTDAGDGHGGTVVNGAVGLVMPINENLRFIPSITLQYADDDYTQTFYGVDTNNASTDLSAFTPSAGIESSQVALVAIRQISERWSVTGTAAYTTLQGDAAKSPITQRGDDVQLFTGFTINYVYAR